MSIALSPSIAPAAGLIVAANPASGKKNQFVLFSESWIALQGFVGAALDLPLSKGDFEAKYGTFDSSKVIKDCITAMASVKTAATEFGDPKALRKALIANPNLLATPTPPAAIYTHTVWLGQRVHETAGKIASGYESVLKELPGMTNKEQVAQLKGYLFDPVMGPIPLAGSMAGEAKVLVAKLRAFEQKMSEYNEKLRSFTKRSSQMVAAVDTIIGSLSRRIQELQAARDAAARAFMDFVIAAVSTTVGCMAIGFLLAPLTAGISTLVGAAAAVAADIGLGIKAAMCMAEYNAYCAQIVTVTDDLQKKQRLRSDLGDFDLVMDRITPAMKTFLKSLEGVADAWDGMKDGMVAINESITESNVGDIALLVEVKANAAIESWKAVDASAKQFTADSLIDYTSLAFGDRIPDSPPVKGVRSTGRLEEQPT